MNKFFILAMAGVMGAYGIVVPREPAVAYIDPPVNLQALTPGIAQSGHARITGTMIVGKLIAQSAGAADRTVSATATSLTGATYGGFFRSQSSGGNGVYGEATSDSGSTAGGRFVVASTSGKAVAGVANALSGRTYGGYFETKSPSGAGIFGYASSFTGNTTAGQFQNNSDNGIAVAGYANEETQGTNFGGYFIGSVFPGGTGVYASGYLGIRGNATNNAGTGVWGTGGAVGVKGTGPTGGYFQSSGAGGYGVYGVSPFLGGKFEGTGNGTGIYAKGKNGVEGESTSSTDSGVWGHNDKGYGVSGSTTSTEASGTAGVWGHNNGTGIGVKGSAAGTGFAGFFDGRLGIKSGNELFFKDNGQIRSLDDRHRILFRRTENKMEFREYGDIIFSTNSVTGLETAKMIIQGTAAAHVGIGTTSPQDKLHVNGVIRAQNGLNLAGPGEHDGNIRSAGRMTFSPGTAPEFFKMILSTEGNLGVGTDSPNARLNVVTSNNDAVHGQASSPDKAGVWGEGSANTGIAYGGYFTASDFTGIGVYSKSLLGNVYGVYGRSTDGWAVFADGLLASNFPKAFRIDHPFDPANKYLYHYAAEGPDPLNVYRGTIVTDAQGFAWVQLPDYFQEINKEPTYQLTVIDNSDDFVLAKVTKESVDNRFQIRTSKPSVKVCWEVEGIRNDMLLRHHTMPVVTEKPERERGTYQRPELYGKSQEFSLGNRLEQGRTSAATQSKSADPRK